MTPAGKLAGTLEEAETIIKHLLEDNKHLAETIMWLKVRVRELEGVEVQRADV